MPRFTPLCGRDQFSHVLGNNSFRKSNSWLTLLAIPNQLGYHRLGVILARKRLKSAVLRNAVKRQLRESIHGNLPPNVGHDLVALARSGAPLQTHQSIATNKQLLCRNVRTLSARMIAAIAETTK